MAITINKVSNTNIVETPLYGKFTTAKSVNLENYTYFDSFKNYDLFISNDAKTKIAIESKALTESNEHISDAQSEVVKIKEKYTSLDTVKYVDSDNTIIIKVLEGDEETIDKIVADYESSKDYIPNKLSDTVLFLDLVDDNIQLEDDDLLNHLDDNTIKDLATKTGAKLSGSESKDELKGIVKGSLTKNN